MNVVIRKAEAHDVEEIIRVCQHSILNACTHEYSPVQRKAWSVAVDNKDRLLKAIQDQYFLVAVLDDEIVGFGSIHNGEYIDFLYVAANHLRKGIADRIYEELVSESRRKNSSYLWANVSKTARPFFERKGFEVEKENVRHLQGVEIVNYRMIRKGLVRQM